MRINTEVGTSEDSRSIVSGSHDESLRVNEIAINFIETGESYDHKSIIVDCCRCPDPVVQHQLV